MYIYHIYIYHIYISYIYIYTSYITYTYIPYYPSIILEFNNQSLVATDPRERQRDDHLCHSRDAESAGCHARFEPRTGMDDMGIGPYQKINQVS